MVIKTIIIILCICVLVSTGGCMAAGENGRIINPAVEGGKEVDSIELVEVNQNVNGINVAVDPRIELLAALQLISSYDKRFKLITRQNFSYKKDMKEYFSSYSSHQTVKIFDRMSKQSFSFDAPPASVLYFSNPLKLTKVVNYSDYLTKRVGKEKLDKFALQLKGFAIDTSFDKFFEAHRDFYSAVVEKTVKLIGNSGYINDLETYYGLKQNSYNIILSPLFHPGGFGPKIRNNNGSYDIYSIIGPSSVENDIPVFGNEDSFKYLVWHEFSHSFVNMLTEENAEEIEKYNRLFTPISKAMSTQAYTNWGTCVNEHIVRAVTSRLAYMQRGKEAYEKAISDEKTRGFAYISELAEKLEEYENNRDKYDNLREFYPELIKVFELTLLK